MTMRRLFLKTGLAFIAATLAGTLAGCDKPAPPPAATDDDDTPAPAAKPKPAPAPPPLPDLRACHPAYRQGRHRPGTGSQESADHGRQFPALCRGP
ncbi:MAG: hypothetical protein WDN06_04695 [Asticcacaulis sp.]